MRSTSELSNSAFTRVGATGTGAPYNASRSCEGLSCVEDGVWETTAGDQGGGLWERLDTFYEWDPTGTGFIESFTDGFEAPASDPDIEAAGDLDC